MNENLSGLHLNIINRALPSMLWGTTVGSLFGNKYMKKNRTLGAILGGIIGATATGGASSLYAFLENEALIRNLRASRKEASERKKPIIDRLNATQYAVLNDIIPELGWGAAGGAIAGSAASPYLGLPNHVIGAILGALLGASVAGGRKALGTLSSDMYQQKRIRESSKK